MPILVALASFPAAAEPPLSTSADPDASMPARSVEGTSEETWANCRVFVWVRASGRVQAAQVMNPSGLSLLDEACLNLAIGQTVSIQAGTAAAQDRWATLRIKWVDMDISHKQPPAAAYQTVPVPLVASDQRLDVGLEPTTIHGPPREGVCAMRVVVSAKGEAHQVKLTRSTGNSTLDEDCVEAVRRAHFTPARRDERDVTGLTHIWIRCVFPD